MSEENQEQAVPEITYQRAKFWRRIFANLVDLLIFAVVAVFLFVGVRAIYMSTDKYQSKENRLTEMKLESSLYVEKDGEVVDVAGAISSDSDTTSSKMNRAKAAIEDFIEYAYTVEGKTVGDEIQNSYDEFRLQQEFLSQPYFVKDNEQVVVNPDCKASYTNYFENVYMPFINEYCQGYLTTRFEEYVDLTMYISRTLVFVEVPIAYCLAGILVYYVPTWIFRRGRMTFGKAIYKISTVDSRLLNPTWQRTLARFLIFYFGILILSVLTFMVPAIISVTLMGFSKKKQGFADYLLDLQEIDTTNSTVFYNLEEALVSKLDNHKTPVEFDSIVRE